MENKGSSLFRNYVYVYFRLIAGQLWEQEQKHTILHLPINSLSRLLPFFLDYL